MRGLEHYAIMGKLIETPGPPTARLEWPASLAARAAVLAAAIALPFYAITTYDGTVAVSVARSFATPLLAVECIIILLCFVDGWNPLATLIRLPRIALAGLTLWVAGASLSSTLAVKPEAAWLLQGMWILHGVFAAALCSRLAGPWRDARVALLVALGLGLLLLSVAVYVVTALRGGDAGLPWQAFSVGVVNPRHYVFYGAPALGLAVAWLAMSEKPTHAAIAALAIFCALHLLAWSGGRNALGIAVTFPLLFALIVRRRWQTVLLTCLVGAVIAFPLTLATAPDRPIYGFNSVTNRFIDNDYANTGEQVDYMSGRSTLWRTSVEMIAERPVTGHGQFQFGLALARSGPDLEDSNVNHPHNAALQFLFDWGVIGTGGLMLLTVPFLVGMARRLQALPQASVPAFAALMALTMSAALDGTFFFNAPLFLAATLLAILASVPATGLAKAESQPAAG